MNKTGDLRLKLLVIVAFGMLACGDSGRRADPSAANTLQSTFVRDDGTTDTLVLHRFTTPEHYSLPFTTYVPRDMRVESSAPGTAEAIQIEPLDSVTMSPGRAFIHVFWYPPGTPEHRARLQVETFASSRGVPVSEASNAPAPYSEDGIPPESGGVIPPRFDWAVIEVPYTHSCVANSNDCVVGRIALGHHAGRYYHVVVQYPPQAANFMQPRVGAIMKHWTWMKSP